MKTPEQTLTQAPTPRNPSTPTPTEDTLVSGNSAYYSNGGGIWAVGDATIYCIASKTASAGFFGNSAVYYGGAVFLSGYDPVLTSDRCDFGEDGTADDNTPQDIYSCDDDASFECISGTCRSQSHRTDEGLLAEAYVSRKGHSGTPLLPECPDGWCCRPQPPCTGGSTRG